MKKITTGSDEFFTPKKVVESILPWIQKFKNPDPFALGSEKNIWCPCDENGSEFVNVLTRDGFRVKATHLTKGFNFLEATKKDVKGIDLIITNPPFSLKDQFIKKCFELDVAFILLLPDSLFDSKERIKLLKDKDIQLIIPDTRIRYMGPDGKLFKCSIFKSLWLTYGLKLDHTFNFYEFKN